ncbi:hypothetical protein NDU88_002389 [Pleurodeles waltl]|uniref:Uncharacterized protein n=1 Tax=Pleurodeles waltl TaxID=8319 RepID=A0AAV7UVF1_PLEWA|nr:hypothetical protein NDU88_002389 [Pleurodeles waltl]
MVCETLLLAPAAGRTMLDLLLWHGFAQAYRFWQAVQTELEEITGERIEQTPLLALLGCDKEVPPVTWRLVALGLLVLSRRIALHWARGLLPTLNVWRIDMTHCNTQSDPYQELLLLCSRLKDIWGLTRHFCLALGRGSV